MDQPNDPSKIADLFRAAIAAQLTAIVSEGISMKTLEKLQRFCAATRQALHAIESPDAKIRDRFGNNSLTNIGPLGPLGVGMMPSVDLTGDEEAYASAPNIETYGANMPRQLISALGKLVPKPSMKDAVDAIVAAESAGMAETAKMLRENLVATFGSAEKHTAVIGDNGKTPLALPAEATKAAPKKQPKKHANGAASASSPAPSERSEEVE
jgi:hypothetical protein